MSRIHHPNFVEMIIQKGAKENEYIASGFITSEHRLDIQDYKKNLLKMNFNDDGKIVFQLEYRNIPPNESVLDLSKKESYDIALTELPALNIWQSYYAPFEAIDKICDIIFMKTQAHKNDELHRYAFVSAFCLSKDILNGKSAKKFYAQEVRDSFMHFLIEDELEVDNKGDLANLFTQPIWTTPSGEKFLMRSCAPLSKINEINRVNRHIIKHNCYPDDAPYYTKNPNPLYLEFIKEMYRLDPDNFYITRLMSEEEHEFHSKASNEAFDIVNS